MLGFSSTCPALGRVICYVRSRHKSPASILPRASGHLQGWRKGKETASRKIEGGDEMCPQHPEPVWNGRWTAAQHGPLVQFVLLTATKIGKRWYPGFCYLLLPPFQKEHLDGNLAPRCSSKAHWAYRRKWTGQGEHKEAIQMAIKAQVGDKTACLASHHHPIGTEGWEEAGGTLGADSWFQCVFLFLSHWTRIIDGIHSLYKWLGQ